MTAFEVAKTIAYQQILMNLNYI